MSKPVPSAADQDLSQEGGLAGDQRPQGAEDPSPSGSFVSGYLLYLLAASSEQASAQFHAQIRAKGLRVPEWRVLACLVDSDGLMITRLAALSLMEQSRMTRIVDQMDTRGLLRRFADPQDKRRVRVALTDQGRALAASLVNEARVHEAQLLSRLADTDAARIKGVLQTLLRTLDSDDPGGSDGAALTPSGKGPANAAQPAAEASHKGEQTSVDANGSGGKTRPKPHARKA